MVIKSVAEFPCFIEQVIRRESKVRAERHPQRVASCIMTTKSSAAGSGEKERISEADEWRFLGEFVSKEVVSIFQILINMMDLFFCNPPLGKRQVM